MWIEDPIHDIVIKIDPIGIFILYYDYVGCLDSFKTIGCINLVNFRFFYLSFLFLCALDIASTPVNTVWKILFSGEARLEIKLTTNLFPLHGDSNGLYLPSFVPSSSKTNRPWLYGPNHFGNYRTNLLLSFYQYQAPKALACWVVSCQTIPRALYNYMPF